MSSSKISFRRPPQFSECTPTSVWEIVVEGRRRGVAMQMRSGIWQLFRLHELVWHGASPSWPKVPRRAFGSRRAAAEALAGGERLATNFPAPGHPRPRQIRV